MGSAKPSTPSHADVAAAVTAAGDPELSAVVHDPNDYVVGPVQLGEFVGHDFFQLTALSAPHGPEVLLARARTTGRLIITSGSPAAVREVLSEDPDLVEPHWIVQLLAPRFDACKYVGPGSDPPVVAVTGGWRCDLRVREGFDGDEQRWVVDLTDPPGWQVS